MKKPFVVWFVLGSFVLTQCRGAEKPKTRLPVLDCVVVYAHGGFNAYGGPQKSDTITIDLNEAEKLKDRLEFKSDRPGPAYIPLRSPLKLIKRMREDLPQYFDMQFASIGNEAPPGKVTVEVKGSGEPGATKFAIYIIAESDGFFTGVAVLEGTARK